MKGGKEGGEREGGGVEPHSGVCLHALGCANVAGVRTSGLCKRGIYKCILCMCDIDCMRCVQKYSKLVSYQHVLGLRTYMAVTDP